MEKKLLWVGLGLLAAVVLIAAAITYFGPRSDLRGAALVPPRPAPPLDLTDQRGQPFSLQAQRGAAVLLYFGYTNCPDQCPIALAKIKQTLLLLGPEAQSVRVALITTDPVRDTPERLATYLSAFDPAYFGLTGDRSVLQAAYAAYGVTVMDNGETHSTRVYLIDPDGNLRATYPYEFDPQDLAYDLRQVLGGR